MSTFIRGMCIAFVGLGTVSPVLAQGPVRTPRVHALTQARIVQAPGRVIENGTVIIRDGVIEAVGVSIPVPPDARVWEADSLTIYAGLIDLHYSVTFPVVEEQKDKPADLSHVLEVVTPEKRLSDLLPVKDSDREARRGQGITTARVIPGMGVFRGQAALLNLGDGELTRNILLPQCGQVVGFGRAPGGDGYPNSTMGAVAVIRQTLFDARWYQNAHAAYAARPAGLERPEHNAALAALGAGASGKERMLFATEDVLELLRAGEIGKEFGLTFDYLGSGEEYKRLDEVKRFAGKLVVPVSFPDPPGVADPGQALSVTLEALRAWDEAPANPAALYHARVPFAVTANGLKDTGQFRKNMAIAIQRGLPAAAALAAATTVPAAMMGVENRLGTVEAGKIANLVVVDGEIFSDSTKVRSVWVDGTRYEVEEVKPPVGDPRGTWEMIAAAPTGEKYPSTVIIGGETGALTASVKVMANEIPATVSQSGTTVVVSFSSAALGTPGTVRMSFDIKGDSATGSGTSPFGEFGLSGTRTEKAPEAGSVEMGGSR